MRVKVLAAGIGLPDILMCQGNYPFMPELPFTNGQEVCGIITDSNENERFQVPFVQRSVGRRSVGRRSVGRRSVGRRSAVPLCLQAGGVGEAFGPDLKWQYTLPAWAAPTKRGRGRKRFQPIGEHWLAKTPAECHASMTWVERLKRVFNWAAFGSILRRPIEICGRCVGQVKITVEASMRRTVEPLY